MTADRDDAAGTGAVVRKPPKNEPAMGGNVRCAARFELRWPWTPMQLRDDGTNVAKRRFHVLCRLWFQSVTRGKNSTLNNPGAM